MYMPARDNNSKMGTKEKKYPDQKIPLVKKRHFKQLQADKVL